MFSNLAQINSFMLNEIGFCKHLFAHLRKEIKCFDAQKYEIEIQTTGCPPIPETIINTPRYEKF